MKSKTEENVPPFYYLTNNTLQYYNADVDLQ